MSYTEQFLTILKREATHELLPFLKSIDENGEKAFVTELKEISKGFLEYKEVRQGNTITFKRKATEKQAELISYAALAFLNQKEFEKAFNLWLTPADKLNEVLSWRCPKWFNRYINKFGNDAFVPNFINYDWIILLTRNGHITPTKELIVKTLPAFLFEQTKDHKYHVRPENLLKYEVTLSEHIWWFFDTENTIYASDRYMTLADGTQNKESQWMMVFRDLADSGKMDKHRVLRETILATNRNYNKPQTGWFADLFVNLEPSVEELVEVQTEILNALNSSHSKPVNVALGAIKKMLDHAKFNFSAFLESTPLLLTSETKSVVNSTLTIIEKAVRKRPDQKAAGCHAVTQTFIHQDDELQTKAAKLIAKLGDPGSDELRIALAAYTGSFLTNARSILAEFIDTSHDAISPDIHEPVRKNIIIDEIPPVNTFDELVFLASQAFDNNQTWHIDQLPEALIRMQDQVCGSNLGKFEPALQRALKVVFDGWTSTTGYLDQLLALFFIDYAGILVKKYPIDALSLQRLLDGYREKEWQNKKQWKGYTFRIIPLAEWKKHDGGTTYDIHKRILLVTLTRLQSNDSLPLLSTPTHIPALIRPDIVLSRLAEYDKKNRTPDDVDLQLAISRCDRSNPIGAEPSDSLKGEYRNLFDYLLKDKAPSPPFHLTRAWLVAAATKHDIKAIDEFLPFSDLSRKQVTGQFYWRAFVEPYMTSRYNAKKHAYEKVPDKRKALKIEITKTPVAADGFVNKLLSLFLKSKPLPQSNFVIYKHLAFNPKYISLEHNDFARLIYLIPNNPEVLVASVISRCMAYPAFGDANEPRLVASTLEALVQLNVRYGETGHLFMATAMLSNDKTIQSFAVELWIKHAGRNIDSEWIGRIIGTIETIEFAPLKRLTDLLSGNMINVSGFHNKELEIFVCTVLTNLNSEAITNLKKLLEIYYELVSINRSEVAESVKNRLQAWSSSPSLKKPIEKLIGIQTMPS
jgi:hypothetical protein